MLAHMLEHISRFLMKKNLRTHAQPFAYVKYNAVSTQSIFLYKPTYINRRMLIHMPI